MFKSSKSLCTTFVYFESQSVISLFIHSLKTQNIKKEHTLEGIVATGSQISAVTTAK